MGRLLWLTLIQLFFCNFVVLFSMCYCPLHDCEPNSYFCLLCLETQCPRQHGNTSYNSAIHRQLCSSKLYGDFLLACHFLRLLFEVLRPLLVLLILLRFHHIGCCFIGCLVILLSIYLSLRNLNSCQICFNFVDYLFYLITFFHTAHVHS